MPAEMITQFIQILVIASAILEGTFSKRKN